MSAVQEVEYILQQTESQAMMERSLSPEIPRVPLPDRRLGVRAGGQGLAARTPYQLGSEPYGPDDLPRDRQWIPGGAPFERSLGPVRGPLATGQVIRSGESSWDRQLKRAKLLQEVASRLRSRKMQDDAANLATLAALQIRRDLLHEDSPVYKELLRRTTLTTPGA